jgi:translocation and assembly module TamB
MGIRRRTLVLATAAVLLGTGAVLAGGVAVLTQTDRGRALIMRAVVPVLSAAVPGRLHVGRVGGTLFTELTVDTLELTEPDGTPFLATGPVRLTYDPRDLLARRLAIKSLEVTRPVVTLIDYGKDDWNWKRALRRVGPRLPRREGGFGDWVTVDTTTVRELTLVMRQPWVLSDTLRGAKRDSALAYNLARLDGEIRRDGDRFVRVWRFVRGQLALGPSRLADPDSAGQRFAVRKADVVWVYPPFWFRNFSGTVRKVADSVWVDGARFDLAQSSGRGEAKLTFGGGLPVRYDVRIRGDRVALSDVAWIDETIPRSGGGSVDLTIANDPADLAVIEYRLRNMDARALRSRLRGDMTFGVGGPVLRVTDVALDLEPAHTDLLRHFNGGPFPYDWQGAVTGRIVARGGPVTRFRLDDAILRYADAHVPGAVSSGRATGMLNLFTPADAVLLGVDVTVDRLDFRTPRFVNPNFLELNGYGRGRARLDSLWYDVRFRDADVELVDGPGDPSRLTGQGRFTLLDAGVRFDVDLQAAPLSYTTLSRSYPGVPLRGLAVGSIRASGMAEDFTLDVTLAGEGGELAFSGRVDGFEPSYAATGAFRLRGVDLQALFGTSGLPASRLDLSGDVALDGADLGSLRGTVRAGLDQFSRVQDARLYGLSLGAAFDSGLVRVDSLLVESSALRLSGAGALGLAHGRAGALEFAATVDSLGGLRPWLARAGSADGGDSAGMLATDTLRGLVEVRGRLSGTVDTADARGLALDARLDGSDLAVGGTRIARAGATVAVGALLRRAAGELAVTADSARLAGVEVASLSARATVADGVAERFTLSVRTRDEARIVVAGGVSEAPEVAADPATRLAPPGAPRTLVTLDTLEVRVNPPWERARGFSLLAPARLTLGPDSSGSLDSLVLVHTDTGHLALRGAVAGDGRVAGRFDADRVPIADLGRLLQRPSWAGGSVSVAASVAGTREAPLWRGTLGLRDARLGRVRLGAFDADARYADRRLALDAAVAVAGRRALVGSVVLPVDLAFAPRSTRLLDAPLEGRIASERTDLALLEALAPSVRGASGGLGLDVALTGTWERPRLRGVVRVDSGAFTLEDLGLRVTGAEADIALAGDTLLVRRLRAASGGAGDTVGVSGRVVFSELRVPSFDLTLAARAFQAIDRPRFASLALTTTRPITLSGTLASPLVRGAVRVDRGRVYVNQLTQRRALDLADDDVIDTSLFGVNALLPSAPAGLVRNLVLDDVRVTLGEDVWLRSPEANIKLGGSLRVTRAAGRAGAAPRLALADSLVVERGTYQLNLGLARPGFEVERGVIRFFGDPELEPALDITALHTVRELRANSNRQDVRIRVAIGGTTARPTLALSSADNPPLPESDMLSYLVTGEPAYSLLGTPYAEQGATLALRLAGSYLSSRLAGGRFDVVQVEPTALNPGDAANLRQNSLGILAATRVGVGGQLTRNTYYSLTTGLCGLAPQASGGGDPLSLFAQGLGVKVERRFDRGLSVALGLEPASGAQACGRLGISRTFQQTPPQVGVDLVRAWTFSGW